MPQKVNFGESAFFLKEVEAFFRYLVYICMDFWYYFQRVCHLVNIFGQKRIWICEKKDS